MEIDDTTRVSSMSGPKFKPAGPANRCQLVLFLVLSSIGLALFNLIFAQSTDHENGWIQRLRVSEDLYGRAFFFFLISIASYHYQCRSNPGISIFELEPSVRWIFSLKMVLNLLFLIFLAYSQRSTPSTSSALLFLTPSLPLIRLFYHCVHTRRRGIQVFSFLLVLPCLFVVVHSYFNNDYTFHLHPQKHDQAYNNPIPSLFSLLCLTLTASLPLLVPDL